MKRIIISVFAITALVFTGCFADSDTATVKINLGNIPVAKTAKVEKKSLIDRFLMLFTKEAIAQQVPSGIGVEVVHLGAFDENNSFLAKKSIRVTDAADGVTNTIVEFEVPARNGVRIVVLGEDENSQIGDEGEGSIATYYGYSDPVDLTADEITPVEIYAEMLYSIFRPDEDNKFKFHYEEVDDYGSPIDDKPVILWDTIYGVSTYIIKYKQSGNNDYEIIHNKSIERCINHLYDNDGQYQFELEFGFAGINSEKIEGVNSFEYDY